MNNEIFSLISNELLITMLDLFLELINLDIFEFQTVVAISKTVFYFNLFYFSIRKT